MTSTSSSAIRPRVIVMTDFPPVDVIPGSVYQKGEPPERYSDPDDVQSMVRLLMCSNDLEVEALIAAARCRHIVMSYNAEGIISAATIERVLKTHGLRATFRRYERRYRRYRADADSRRSYRGDVVSEYLFCVSR